MLCIETGCPPAVLLVMGQHHARNLLAGILAQDLFEFLRVHLALEGEFELGVGCGVDRTVDGVAAAELDVSLRGVEVRELPGTMSPSWSSAEKMTFSAARPWWVGRKK